MTNSRAIVTIVTGKYFDWWKQYAQANWQAYADKYHYDLVILTEPLDKTERAQKRGVVWQKLIIASQDFSKRYQRLVWLDSDIVINNFNAPDILDGVPETQVGAVPGFSLPMRWQFVEADRRNLQYWRDHNARYNYRAVIVDEPTTEDFYANLDLPHPGIDEVMQGGVLTYTPHEHRELLEHIYYSYEEKMYTPLPSEENPAPLTVMRPQRHGEMRQMSYEILRAGKIHWLDYRFNYLWHLEKLLHYPFLQNLENVAAPSTLSAAQQNQYGVFDLNALKRACIMACFINCYFLHFAGNQQDIPFVDLNAQTWYDVTLNRLAGK